MRDQGESAVSVSVEMRHLYRQVPSAIATYAVALFETSSWVGCQVTTEPLSKDFPVPVQVRRVFRISVLKR